jgi:DNA topoisomerase-6 subunit B
VPDIRGTITKIMNVVWMEDSVAYEKKRHHVSVKMYNYTPKSQSFHLHMLVPHESIDKKTLELEPIEVREGNKLTWDIKRVASTEMYELKFDLVGLPQEEYDENEIYVSGIDAASVIGVDVLPGDWDLEHLKIVEEGVPEAVAEEGEEGEIDYDEGAEAINHEE